MLAISAYSASARSMVSVRVFKLSRVGDANLLISGRSVFPQICGIVSGRPSACLSIAVFLHRPSK